MGIALRYAARSDVGLVRSNNQDSGYAGPHLLVVCDGMGGHVGGDVASSLAIGDMVALDGESHGADDALEQLAVAIAQAHATLLERVDAEPSLTGMGTTVTALLRAGSRLALGHIGDSRAYLLRDGELVQLTHDHTFVQSLVDEGRITPEEAEQHPQRSVIMRVLSDLVPDATPDLSMREARVGDRYLLCSDGLSGVVSHDTLQQTLAEQDSPDEVCDKLVALALRAGAPDNVTCIVADVVDAGEPVDDAPVVVGAAARAGRSGGGFGAAAGSAAARAAALTGRLMGLDPDADDEDSPRRRSRRRLLLALAAAVTAIAAVSASGVWWLSGQYFVGASDGQVAVFRGLTEDLGPVSLSRVDHLEPVWLADLPRVARDRLREGIVADSEDDALVTVSHLRDQAASCRAWRDAQASPTPTRPTATPGSPATPTASSTATSPSGSSTPGTSASGTSASGTRSPAPAATPRPTASARPAGSPAPTATRTASATPTARTTVTVTATPTTPTPTAPTSTTGDDVPPAGGDCDGIG